MSVAPRYVPATSISAQIADQSISSAPVLTFSLLGTIAIGFIILAVLIWLWGSFLDIHEHNPARVRSTMLGVLIFGTAFEMGIAAHGLTLYWVAVVSLIVNLWGGLDALLRFPAAHEFESFFATKQFLLLVAKTFSYAFGIVGFREHVGMFLLFLLINIWGLPVLYLMALPLDPAEQVVADERDDVDLVVRVWQLTTCHTERQRCLRSCNNWLHRRFYAISQRSPIAKIALCAASPTYRRAFSKGRCSV